MPESANRPSLFERLHGALEEGVRFAKGELVLRNRSSKASKMPARRRLGG
jgi:hypothetical protein